MPSRLQHLVRCLAFILPFLLLPCGWADERILDFHSYIKIREDGSLLVTETFTINVEHDRFKHGPYRDLITRYRNREGQAVNASVQILDVERNNQHEPHHTSQSDYDRGLRIYIGSPHVYVPRGKQTYELTYLVDRGLVYGDKAGLDYDELYWNVTGTGWAIPIDDAAATVVLPGYVEKFPLLQGYVGPHGSREASFTSDRSAGSTVRLRATRPLAAYEGFTFELGFPKGLVRQPNAAQELFWFLRDNFAYLLAFLSMCAVFGYYLTAWYKVGRDPKPGTIVPLYYPPKDLSPAQIRYVMNMGSDTRTFAAALVNLAVKGAIRLEEDKGLFGKSYVIHSAPNQSAGLDAEEVPIMSELAGTHYLMLKSAEGERIKALLDRFEDRLKSRMQRKYFVTNMPWLIPGVVIMVVSLALKPFLDKTTLYAMLGMEGLLTFGFYWLMRAPTEYGRSVMDKIEGFKLFLSVAEKDRMNYLNPPEITPEVFEKYLPYALALEVENEWADSFNKALIRAGQNPYDYKPGWYYGNDIRSIERLCDNLGDSLSSAVQSSLPSDSAGGGGSSGGGGGGGGGGGW